MLDNNDETGLNNTLPRYAYYQTLSGLLGICVKVLLLVESRSIPPYYTHTNIVLLLVVFISTERLLDLNRREGRKFSSSEKKSLFFLGELDELKESEATPWTMKATCNILL